MESWCLVIADGRRARFFTVDFPDPNRSHIEGGPKLSEHEDLASPEAGLTDRELFRNLKGRNRAPGGGPAHGYDDHRSDNRAKTHEQFARRIAETTRDWVAEHNPKQLVLVAEPKMMGALRSQLDRGSFNGLKVTELTEDLSRHAARDIHEVLVKRGILPSLPTRPRAYRPPGQPIPEPRASSKKARGSR